MMETASTSAPGVSPTDLSIGLQVDIESRTWSGINKPGGHATITKIHYDNGNDDNISNALPTKVDVKYVLGGRENGVELTYVKVYVEIARGGRRRRNDVKMNVETLGAGSAEKKKKKSSSRGGGNKKSSSSGGGAAKKTNKGSSPMKNKKRKALASLDGNHGKFKKDDGEEEEKSSTKEADNVVETVEEVGVDGKWTLIESGKTADYTNILRKGQRISYWWSDEDGWLPGSVSKALAKVVTASTIKWTVKVDFDNGDQHILSFHPLEKRWKVFHSNKPSAAKDEPKKSAPAGEKKEADKKVKANNKKVGEKDTKVKASKKKPTAKLAGTKSNNNSQTKAAANSKQKQPTLSFGSNLQSKIKEISSRMHTASTKAPEDEDDGLVSYSPNSILAVKAAHAKSPMPPHSTTASIGYSVSFPRGTLSPDKKNGKKFTQDIEEKAARASGSQVSLVTPPSPESGICGGAKKNDNKAKKKGGVAMSSSKSSSNTDTTAEVFKSQGSMAYAKSLKTSSNGGESTVMQSLYKSECSKAEKFVDYMTGPSAVSSSCKVKNAAPPSPECDDDGDLELKMDQERVRLFNSILSEIMFRQKIDEMDVVEMIEKLNAHHKASKPFTMLEIKPYLQALHDESRIFFVEDEGRMGVVYAI